MARQREESTGTHTESQQMLAIGELLKKPSSDKDEVKQFRTRIAKDQKEMKGQLQQRLRQAQERDAKRRNNLAALIASILSPPNHPAHPTHDAETFPNTTIATNPMYRTAKKIHLASENLVSMYTTHDAMVAGLAAEGQGQVSDKWTQDVAETERKLRLGHKVATRNLRKVLGAHVEREDEDEDAEMDGEGMKVGELNYKILRGLNYA